MNVHDLERENLQQIEDLNQRGGRTLSIVDLIEANTLSLDVAAYLLCRVSRGASFLTAARPGGAGKTTLLACLLSFLRPGTRIVTVADPSLLRSVPPADSRNPRCYLAHEIGSGHYYGYIWNEDVRRFLALPSQGHIVASCLHADTLSELMHILVDTLQAPAPTLSRVELLLFMRVHRSGPEFLRRVAAVYEAEHAHPHHVVFRWSERHDSFERVEQGQRDAELERKARDVLERLLKDGVRDFAEVRARLRDFLTS